jgi:DNA-binding GntR family transcriptional regulator
VSPLLMQFIGTLWDQCRLTTNVYARDLSHRSRSNADHEQIMAAVHAGQGELAAELISTHVSNAMDEILDKNVIQALGERTEDAAGAIRERS